jgi:tripartite-type tricarboxylate transporter receptor subunit TctC
MKVAGLRFALVLAAAITAVSAHAQPFPAKPIRVIIPLGAGGGTDTLTRIIAPKISEFLGQHIIVDNRPGAGTQIGTELAARAAPDGYTLLNVDTSFPSNPSLHRKLPYDSAKDFAPVSLLASAPVVLVVHSSVPAQTLKELLALARARPGQLNFAFGGYGTATHMGVELFRSAAKVDVVLIPYKGGGPAAADVIAGQVAMLFAGPASVKQHVGGGRLRAIAVTGEKRNASMPAVPTFNESALPGVNSGSYWGSLAPGATPRDIITTLSNVMSKALQFPEIRNRLIDLGYDPIGGTPEEFADNLRTEMTKWAKIVKDTGIRIN